MSGNKFNMIFSMDVLHSYFEQGICNCLLFTATDDTHQLIKRFGFLIRKKINGFDFYIDSNKPLAAFFDYITHVTDRSYFEFKIDNTNECFNIFTEYPVDRIGQMLYTSKEFADKNQGNRIQLKGFFSEQNDVRDFGTLKIYFNDLINFQNDATDCCFEISFDARATQWQYYIINKSEMPLENLSVTGKSEITFGAPDSITIQTGQQALLFSSGEKRIPLSEIPKYKFDLVNKSGASNSNIKSSPPKMIFKGLPNPDPGKIETMVIKGEKLVSSPMYVYV